MASLRGQRVDDAVYSQTGRAAAAVYQHRGVRLRRGTARGSTPGQKSAAWAGGGLMTSNCGGKRGSPCPTTPSWRCILKNARAGGHARARAHTHTHARTHTHTHLASVMSPTPRQGCLSHRCSAPLYNNERPRSLSLCKCPHATTTVAYAGGATAWVAGQMTARVSCTRVYRNMFLNPKPSAPSPKP